MLGCHRPHAGRVANRGKLRKKKVSVLEVGGGGEKWVLEILGRLARLGN